MALKATTNGTTNNALDARRWRRRTSRPVSLPLLAHVVAVDDVVDMAQAQRWQVQALQPVRNDDRAGDGPERRDGR